MIVDPPDGRIPPLTPEAQERVATRVRQIKEKCADPGRTCLVGIDGQPALADNAKDRPLQERCLLWPQAGPPMLPDAYNNNYWIVQTPDYVMISIEAIHDVRIIPLDGRPHLEQNIRQWIGDPRGRWEATRWLSIRPISATRRTSRMRAEHASDRTLHAHGPRYAPLRIYRRRSEHVHQAVVGGDPHD